VAAEHGTIGSRAGAVPGDEDERPLWSRPIHPWIVLGSVVLGVVLRLWVATMGFNLDVVSYSRVVAIVLDGDNVYAATHSYNYGPVWFNLLHLLGRLSMLTPDPHATFRLLLAVLLTLADLGIFAVLRRRGGDGVAIAFILNPVSITITGYHRQFGNLAVLLGLAAAALFDRSDRNRLDGSTCAAMVALGASLATKHVLFAFSWWMAVKKRRLHHKLVVLMVPILIFAASFAPYWVDGRQGIIENVFLYRSLPNQPLWSWAVPPLISTLVPASVGLLTALAIGGPLFRRRSTVVSLLLYTAILVAFTPAMANQYLALAMPFAVWFVNPFTIAYTLTAGALLVAAPDGLELAPSLVLDWMYDVGYGILVALLVAGLGWIFCRERLIEAMRRFGRWMILESKTLLGRDGVAD
jgi:hypothetical protein